MLKLADHKQGCDYFSPSCDTHVSMPCRRPNCSLLAPTYLFVYGLTVDKVSSVDSSALCQFQSIQRFFHNTAFKTNYFVLVEGVTQCKLLFRTVKWQFSRFSEKKGSNCS